MKKLTPQQRRGCTEFLCGRNFEYRSKEWWKTHLALPLNFKKNSNYQAISTCVTAAGWRAGNTWLTSSGRSRIRPEHAPGCYGYPVYYGDEYYFYLWVGTYKPHRKVAGLVLSVLVITSSRAIWLSG